VAVGGHPDFYGLDVIIDELQNASGRKVRFQTSMAGLLLEALLIARQVR
jgi:hypothetical protein